MKLLQLYIHTYLFIFFWFGIFAFRIITSRRSWTSSRTESIKNTFLWKLTEDKKHEIIYGSNSALVLTTVNFLKYICRIYMQNLMNILCQNFYNYAENVTLNFHCYKIISISYELYILLNLWSSKLKYWILTRSIICIDELIFYIGTISLIQNAWGLRKLNFFDNIGLLKLFFFGIFNR